MTIQPHTIALQRQLMMEENFSSSALSIVDSLNAIEGHHISFYHREHPSFIDYTSYIVKLRYWAYLFPEQQAIQTLIEKTHLSYEETLLSSSRKEIISSFNLKNSEDITMEDLLVYAFKENEFQPFINGYAFTNTTLKYCHLYLNNENINSDDLMLYTLYQTLFTHLEKLLMNPDDYDELFKFWEENSDYFILLYSVSQKDLKDFFEKKSSDIKQVQFEIEMAMIKLLQHDILEKCFIYFLKYPEKQEHLVKGFPAFYKFLYWTDHRLDFYISELNNSHIDALVNLKNDKLYPTFVSRICSVKTDYSDNKNLNKFLENSLALDSLFSCDYYTNKNIYNLKDFLQTEINSRTYIPENAKEVIQSFIKLYEYYHLKDQLVVSDIKGKKSKI